MPGEPGLHFLSIALLSEMPFSARSALKSRIILCHDIPPPSTNAIIPVSTSILEDWHVL